MQHSLASFPPNRRPGRPKKEPTRIRISNQLQLRLQLQLRSKIQEITQTGNPNGTSQSRITTTSARRQTSPAATHITKGTTNNSPSCFALVIANPPSEHLLRLPFLSTFSRLGLTVAIRRKGRPANQWARLHSEVGFHGKSSHLLSPRNPKRVEDRFNLIQVSRRPE